MADSKHTPGPWHVGKTAPCIVYDDNGWGVANTVNHDRYVYAMQANARLIAAAPDMLAALQAILQGVKHDDTGDGYAEIVLSTDDARTARAAVAKATGEPHA
jgi:hypothetical protein